MARLSLSELTNQLSNTRTAFEKWEEQVITQTNAAKQQHLDKLADKQRECSSKSASHAATYQVRF